MMRADVAGRARTVRHATPVRPARAGLRLAAYLVDWLVMVIVGSLLISAGGLQLYFATDRGRESASDLSVYLFLVLCALAAPVWAVMTLVGWGWYGRSVGKLAIGLRIVGRAGGPPGAARATVRLLIYALENVPLALAPAVIALRIALDETIPEWAVPAGLAPLLLTLAAFLPALLSPTGRTLHDLVAGTVVVEE